MDAEILQQLVWIKWLIAIPLICLVVIIVSAILIERQRSTRGSTGNCERPFQKSAQDLLDRAEYEKLHALAEERLKNYPADGYAHWYIAKSAFRLGDFETSRAFLQMLLELNPEWDRTYVSPLLQAIERERTRPKKKKSGNLRLVESENSDCISDEDQSDSPRSS